MMMPKAPMKIRVDVEVMKATKRAKEGDLKD
jgi:hypothetical protein